MIEKGVKEVFGENLFFFHLNRNMAGPQKLF